LNFFRRVSEWHFGSRIFIHYRSAGSFRNISTHIEVRKISKPKYISSGNGLGLGSSSCANRFSIQIYLDIGEASGKSEECVQNNPWNQQTDKTILIWPEGYTKAHQHHPCRFHKNHKIGIFMIDISGSCCHYNDKSSCS
jgi:hypothetical protein